MTYYLGARSRKNLEGVHPLLARAVDRAIALTTQDFCIIDGGGLRTADQARANRINGTGVANSLHLPQADGYSHAVDLVAYENGRPTWGRGKEDVLRLYMPIRAAMLQACDEVGLPIQHGADWDLDGNLNERGEFDWPHYQIPNIPRRCLDAVRAMLARRIERGA